MRARVVVLPVAFVPAAVVFIMLPPAVVVLPPAVVALAAPVWLKEGEVVLPAADSFVCGGGGGEGQA
jgi:hypothetical protein